MVPKKTGDLRPVIDLSTLNCHMLVPHLKMEMQGSVRSAIRSQEWTVSLVIHDAYLHVPMHQAVRKYLRFVVNKKVFTCLPFGLATSVREFIKLLRPVVALLRQQGVKLHVYLDDWLIRADTPGQAKLHAQTTIRVLQFLGWIINYEKLDLTPSQDFQFIGMQFNTRQFAVAPLPKMCLEVKSVHQHWMTNLNITASDLHRLLGMLVFMVSLVQRVKLRLRPVQWWTATAWCQRTGSWSDRIQVPQWVLSEVAWWASPAVLQGPPLAGKETEVTLFTDASSSGWGAQLGSQSTSWHINALEMQAVINAVRDFLPHLRSWVVCLMCDNAVTVAYIKNEGGTRSHTLMQMTIRLLKWCDIGSRPSARNAQHSGGFPVQNRPDTDHGVDYGHGASKTHVCQVGRAAGRLVCDIPQQTTHQICIAVYGPQGRVDRCHGATGGPTCTRSSHSRWSLKFCRRSLSLQVSGWFWSLNCNRQRHGFQSWWICPKKIRSRCTSKFKQDLLTQDVLIGDGVTETLTSGRQIYTRGNSTGLPEGEGPFQESCQHVNVPMEIITPSVRIPLVKIRGVL